MATTAAANTDNEKLLREDSQKRRIRLKKEPKEVAAAKEKAKEWEKDSSVVNKVGKRR